VIGWKWGSLVLLLDAIKGLVPTLAASLFLKSRTTDDGVLLATIATGVSAILGHMYPIWLKLRGGKGVATALGVVLVISPMASAVALGLFLAVLATTRIVAAASIAASVGFAATQLALLGSSALELSKLPLTLFSIVVPSLIVWRHRSNILRLLRGEENRIASKRKSPNTESTGSDKQS
jgi:glycerol-3-phosphate acyltransferase PlsY